MVRRQLWKCEILKREEEISKEEDTKRESNADARLGVQVPVAHRQTLRDGGTSRNPAERDSGKAGRTRWRLCCPSTASGTQLEI